MPTNLDHMRTPMSCIGSAPGWRRSTCVFWKFWSFYSAEPTLPLSASSNDRCCSNWKLLVVPSKNQLVVCRWC